MPPAPPLLPRDHRARVLTTCALTALLAWGPHAAPAAVAADSVGYDFESTSTNSRPFAAINGFGGVVEGPAPDGKPGRAARFNVPNDGRSSRPEPAVKRLGSGTHPFSFANYLPEDWRHTDFDTIVAQWLSTQPDTKTIKPVVALAVHDGDWMSRGAGQETISPLGPARVGHWNHWDFDITWSSGTVPGSITAMCDSVRVGSHRGNNNYHRGQPPHFRIGVHRPGWRPEKGAPHRAGLPEAVLYADDISITGGPGVGISTAGSGPAGNSPATTALSPSTASASSAPPTPTASLPDTTGAGQAVAGQKPSGHETAGGSRTGAGLPPSGSTAGQMRVIGAVGGVAALTGAAILILRRRTGRARPGGDARDRARDAS
ncbi:heparin lyase I family protein [Streptomyces sp. SP18CS02]|uniref:heparin lyase I family protein n=1 Tax=Streptomyces sp. SP18CS02 TaxID=3002531 RepID=UPI002E79C900|nr:heparin lyase I family protein [Streptomyces sp. SP18CS02]MEE1754467.1 heparin lyase I family protein [Streptomyces sp. SP18CS02]